MTEKKARSAFVPILAILAVLMLGVVTLLTVVPLKTCEAPCHYVEPSPINLKGCRRCNLTGKVVVWDLWGMEPQESEYDDVINWQTDL